MALCGAKNRSGEPCKKFALKGAKRCRLHGGASKGPPKGSTNALKHGIYGTVLTDEEKALSDQIQLGKIDDELKLCRIRLVRALKLESEHGDDLQADSRVEKGATTESIPLEEGATKIIDVTYKRRDYSVMVDRLLARIESLEKTRAELMKVTSETVKDEPVTRIEIEVVSAKPKNNDDGAAG